MSMMDDACLVPDLMVPSQWSVRCVESPEHALMCAVLDDAWRCATMGRGDRMGLTRAQVLAEAHDWFARTDHRWPFSFENICAVLLLSPAAVRARLEAVRGAAGAGGRIAPGTLPIAASETCPACRASPLWRQVCRAHLVSIRSAELAAREGVTPQMVYKMRRHALGQCWSCAQPATAQGFCARHLQARARILARARQRRVR